MYKFSYDEILVDGSANQRIAEKQALEHSIGLLREAEKKGASSREAIDAILFVNRLWSFILEELIKPENELSEKLRASLISIGIWVLREADAITDGKSRNLRGLIEVTEIIAEGLQ